MRPFSQSGDPMVNVGSVEILDIQDYHFISHLAVQLIFSPRPTSRLGNKGRHTGSTWNPSDRFAAIESMVESVGVNRWECTCILSLEAEQTSRPVFSAYDVVLTHTPYHYYPTAKDLWSRTRNQGQSACNCSRLVGRQKCRLHQERSQCKSLACCLQNQLNARLPAWRAACQRGAREADSSPVARQSMVHSQATQSTRNKHPSLFSFIVTIPGAYRRF
ncbi:hypothetical protein GGR57DRAFT_164827 [Xylariaceae sp. FL1272]|nr:hypothetical protein GGR57DRAFT_164827 [Xylariaceae sp. FL1272]